MFDALLAAHNLQCLAGSLAVPVSPHDPPAHHSSSSSPALAGLIARRILCSVREGDPVTAGDRFGIIRFGSRTDLYLPEGVLPLVVEGQTMIGGETVIAQMVP